MISADQPWTFPRFVGAGVVVMRLRRTEPGTGSPAAVFDFKGELVGMCGIPRGFVFEHGVEDDEQFSHAGHDDFFGSFFVFSVGTES